jgi:hypothetical protein
VINPKTAQSFLFEVDRTGKCLKQLSLLKAVDLRPHFVDRRLVYSYMEIEETVYDYSIFGFRRILDENFQPLQSIKTLSPTIFRPVAMDFHEFELLASHSFTSIGLIPSFDWLGRCFLEQSLTESVNGDSVFSWRSDLVPRSADRWYYPLRFRGYLCFDPSHINSFQRTSVPAGYVVSSKASNSISFIPKNSPASSWTLGGSDDEFHIPPAAVFGGQHGVLWSEATQTLTLFDNGSNYLSMPTGFHSARVIEFKLDTSSKKILSWKTVVDFGERSDRHGGIGACGPECYDVSTGLSRGIPDLVEYDARKNKTEFEFRLGPQLEGFEVYRFYRVPDSN